MQLFRVFSRMHYAYKMRTSNSLHTHSTKQPTTFDNLLFQLAF
jgi:hypothetical protein